MESACIEQSMKRVLVLLLCPSHLQLMSSVSNLMGTLFYLQHNSMRLSVQSPELDLRLHSINRSTGRWNSQVEQRMNRESKS